MAFRRSLLRRSLVLLDDVGGGVAKLTLNDPNCLNALTVEMGEAFVNQVHEVNALVRKGDVRAVVPRLNTAHCPRIELCI